MKPFWLGVGIAVLTLPALAQTPPTTPVAEASRGMAIVVQGVVERITDEDEFRLADATGSILVYIGPNRMPAQIGETITVEGQVDDDPGPLEIYARTLTRADGTVVTFDMSDEW